MPFCTPSPDPTAPFSTTWTSGTPTSSPSSATSKSPTTSRTSKTSTSRRNKWSTAAASPPTAPTTSTRSTSPNRSGSSGRTCITLWRCGRGIGRWRRIRRRRSRGGREWWNWRLLASTAVPTRARKSSRKQRCTRSRRTGRSAGRNTSPISPSDTLCLSVKSIKNPIKTTGFTFFKGYCTQGLSRFEISFKRALHVFDQYLNIMSQSEGEGTTCSSCSKPKQKYDVFTVKCTRHSYKLCGVCTRKERGSPCPDCESQKTTEGRNGNQANGEYSKSQKDMEIKNLTIEMYKLKEESSNKIEALKAAHEKTINDLRANFEKEANKENEKREREFNEKIAAITRERDDLNKKLEGQKAELLKVSELEKNLMKTNFQNEKQALLLDTETKKREEYERNEKKEREMKQRYEEEIKSLRSNYDQEIKQLKSKLDTQRAELTQKHELERTTSQKRHESEKKELESRLQAEKEEVAKRYEAEKEVERGSFIQQKSGLESLVELKASEYQAIIQKLNEEKQRMGEEMDERQRQFKAQSSNDERTIAEKSMEISRLSSENEKLSNYIATHDKSLDYYKKEIDDFDQHIERNNRHIIAQFKSLDDTYAEPTPEKMKQTQLLVRQYKEVVSSTQHPLLSKIISEKESMVSSYVAGEMKNFGPAVEDLDLRDVFYIHSEKGKKFKRIVEKIDLIRSLDNRNINDSIELYFLPKLHQKIREILLKCSDKINEYNNQLSEFDLIRSIDEYEELKDYLAAEFKDHREVCANEYKTADDSVRAAFDRFRDNFNRIKEDKPVEKLEEYLNKAQNLKKFIQITHHGKQYKKYTYYLENHLSTKMEAVNKAVIIVLNQNKKKLKEKLQVLMKSREYFDCYLYQKIFKKLKIFDEILTKEENSLYNFNFSQLYNKILNFLKILKEEKLNLIDVIVTEEKINVDQLETEYEKVTFDESVRNRYLYKIKTVLQNRTVEFNKINSNTIITDKHLEHFQSYLVEALELQEIKQINDLPEIAEQVRAIQQKLPLVITYLEAKFKEYYLRSCEYKELDENNLVIRHHLEFQTFVQNYFKADHDQFKANILAARNKDLPEPQSESECVFRMLLRLNSNHQKVLEELVNNPDEPFREEYFQFHTNMVTYTPKLSANKIQKKLERNILESIGQLEAKEWSEGEVNSVPERKLMQRLNKLQNKEIAYYRELTNIHKSKVIDERQRLINSEKRKLKEDDFENLSSFISQCQKHEQTKSKFYKLYINILDEYTTYSYDNISNDNDKKCAFLNKLYKLNLADSKGPGEIFKSKEHKIYFCRPELELVRGNIQLIEKFQGDNETIVNKVTESLVNAYKLYSVFRKNEDKSLLDEKERKKFHDEIDGIKADVVNNFQGLCKGLDHENIFEEKCNRKKLFLELVKIEIYSKLMKKFQDISPSHEYYSVKGSYEEIIKRINTKIEKVFEEVKQFKFYKDELKLQYDNNQFLYEHLKKVERVVEVFKDVKFKLYKYESYLKNNYLEDLRLKDINHKEIIRIIEMAWIKEYTVIKKEITEMFHNQQMDIVLKYKMILHQKEIVKNQNMMTFNEIIKEEYDFKKIVIHELLEIQEKMERNVQNLEKEYETFSFNMKKMEEKKKIYIDTTKDAIKTKYDKLIEEVKNSFHEIEDETLRQQKIEAELNTLVNQARAEEQSILNQEVAKTEFFRKKFNSRAENIVYKIFQNFLMVKKVESNFDIEIEELCKKILAKIQYDIDKYDKNIKNVFVNYVKKSNSSDLKMGAASMNIFKQVNEEEFRQNTMAMNDIHEIIKKTPQIRDDQQLTRELVSAYEAYRDELQRVEGQYIESKSENNIIQLIKETKAQARELTPSVIIARIFAVYSIYRCIDAHQEETSFDGNPHISQVVAILLLIDAYHHQNARLSNRLIEVKTGEGKSRVLGGLNCYLALLGFDVYCGCYSSYLSKRDEEEFKSLFVRFGVNNMISYGPFSEHCESVFNEADKHNFKEVTKKVLLNEKLSKMQLEYLERLNKLLKRESRVNRILVIDEVDVFFDEHYFGQLYTPGVAIDAPEVKKLMQYIWANHNDKKLNKMTFQSAEYQALIDLYPHLNELLKNQVESMIHACNNYNIHPYEIRNNEIQYVDNDTVNSKLNFGYSTAFASCFEYERGKISEENYNKNTNISLIIGQFSYAELPKYFDHIMGVSGTVEAMSDFRKKIMREDYQITQIFALPSIYGDSHREILGFHACKEKQYLEFLLDRINDVRKERRPILVFFETEDKLNMISNSPQFNQFTTNIYKITEKMPPEMRNPLINYAGTQNRITLISSAFSRGTDFTVYDTQINQKGGMHVIQTYISKNQSDFIQIMGRTGRQGKKGTFEMIVTETDLEKNGIRLSDGKELFQEIKKSWKSRDFSYGQQLAKSIEKASKQHEKTFEVVSTLNKANQKLVAAVTKLNFNEIKNETIRTVIAIDGTGSMGAALNAVLTILNDTISRTEEIINMRIPNVSFEHKIMIYRNYNIKPFERILQQSDFSKDPGYLQAFMTSIKPEGGLGNEAHQILFYDIGRICEFENVDQIIIIGDAPANKYEEMTKHRKKFHGEAVWTKKYPLLPSIEKYSQVVVRENIPVHSFFILRRKQEEEAIKWDNSVKQYFEELSRKSKGLSDELNIRDQEKARTQLTDFISERVLDLIGGRDLVELYSKMYSKRYV